MSKPYALEELMNLFEVRIEAFAICEIEKTAALICDPHDSAVVHFVLRGEGILRYENGERPLCPNSVVIVPRLLPKTISGEGPVKTVCNAKEHCILHDELIQFKAGTHPDLVLGCAAVHASIGGVIDVFEYLWEPMVEDTAGTKVAPLFAMIERELAEPGVGTRAVVGALMKQVLIAVFRSQISQESYRGWLWPAMMNPQLGRAALAMMSRPQDNHTIESLSDLAAMSRSRFLEHFGEVFERSPFEFLQAVRLNIAKRMLTSSSLPVKSVAASVGYASRSHFSRCFRAKYGSDPSAFRKNGKGVQTKR